MRTILLLFGCFFSVTVFAQTRYQYQGNFELGLVNGGSGAHGFLHTSHGIGRGNWTLQLGTGIDYYRFRTIPVFLDLKKQFGKKSTRVFGMVSGGLSLEWIEAKPYQHNPISSFWLPRTDSRFYNGYTARVGAGVIFKAEKKTNFAVSAGWSLKTLTEKYEEWNMMPGPMPPDMIAKTFVYQLNRIYAAFSVNF